MQYHVEYKETKFLIKYTFGFEGSEMLNKFGFSTCSPDVCYDYAAIVENAYFYNNFDNVQNDLVDAMDKFGIKGIAIDNDSKTLPYVYDYYYGSVSLGTYVITDENGNKIEIKQEIMLNDDGCHKLVPSNYNIYYMAELMDESNHIALQYDGPVGYDTIDIQVYEGFDNSKLFRIVMTMFEEVRNLDEGKFLEGYNGYKTFINDGELDFVL